MSKYIVRALDKDGMAFCEEVNIELVNLLEVFSKMVMDSQRKPRNQWGLFLSTLVCIDIDKMGGEDE